jgi:hypothetical protein
MVDIDALVEHDLLEVEGKDSHYLELVSVRQAV